MKNQRRYGLSKEPNVSLLESSKHLHYHSNPTMKSFALREDSVIPLTSLPPSFIQASQIGT